MLTGVLLALLAAFLGALFIREQRTLKRKALGLPGPELPLVPFFGSIFDIIAEPFKFYARQESLGQITWNYFLGRFVVFTKDPGAIRKVFMSPSFKLFLLDNARPLFTIPYLSPAAHMRIRKSALPLFTPGALGDYVPLWEKQMRTAMDGWVQEAREGVDDRKGTEYEKDDGLHVLKPGQGILRMRSRLHVLTMNASMHALVGVHNLPIPPEVFASEYAKLNEGLLSFPINLPGTPLNKAIRSRGTLHDWLRAAVTSARSRLGNGEQPSSLLERWLAHLLTHDPLRSVDFKPSTTLPPESTSKSVTDDEVCAIILDLFFAAQDATVSAMTSLYSVLGDHRKVVEKLREEHSKVRGEACDRPLTPAVLGELVYTRKVVREVLRLRVPPPMVPHIATENTTLPPAIDGSTPEVAIEKGTIVIPSILHGSRNTAIDASFGEFDPDRENPPTGPYSEKPYWVFGAGKHLCLGKDYAQMQLVLHLSLMLELSLTNRGFDFERVWTPDADVDIFGPSIFAKDGVFCVWGAAGSDEAVETGTAAA